MREQTMELGGGLFGVLTLPAQDRPERAVVVLLNAGLIHRVGPFRLHVQLARALAQSGHAVLRFDLPGIGDAPLLADLDAQGAATRALDALQQHFGERGFVVGGICSAADLGWKLAQADRRVRGLLLLDGFAERGFWFRVGQLRLLLQRPLRSWPGMLRRRAQTAGAITDDDLRDWPPAGAAQAQLRQMLERGVRVFALYTGGVAAYFLHPRQFAATFGAAARHPGLTFEYWPDCDHLFMDGGDRERLLQAVRTWCAQA